MRKAGFLLTHPPQGRCGMQRWSLRAGQQPARAQLRRLAQAMENPERRRCVMGQELGPGMSWPLSGVLHVPRRLV